MGYENPTYLLQGTTVINYFNIAGMILFLLANPLLTSEAMAITITVNGKSYLELKDSSTEAHVTFADLSSIRNSNIPNYKSVDIIVQFKKPAPDGALSASYVWSVNCDANLRILETQIRHAGRNGRGPDISSQASNTPATVPAHLNNLKSTVCSRFSGALSSLAGAVNSSTRWIDKKRAEMDEKRDRSTSSPESNNDGDKCRKRIEKLEKQCAAAGDIDRCIIIKGRDEGVVQVRDWYGNLVFSCR